MHSSLFRLSLTCAFGTILSVVAVAGLGPENVLVVVNGDSPGSVRVASEYARLRDIPPSNFVVLHHLGGPEFIDVQHFRDDILKPVLAAIHERGLDAQIDCITYSTDIPYSVNVASDINGRPVSQVATQPASINGLTYLYEWTLKGDNDYLRLDLNRYCRRLLPLPEGVDLTPAEQTDYALAMSEYGKKNYKKAAQILAKLMEQPRTDPNIAYNLACCQALTGDSDEAIASLRKAVAAGWRNFGQTSSDPDLASLAKLSEFNQVLKLIQLSEIDVQPGIPFRSQAHWNRSGAPDTAGPKYMLSTVLGVTAGRGNSLVDVLTYLGSSKDADFTAPKGTIYFERNGDVRSKTREWGFQPAADALAKLGVNAIVEDGVLPQNRTDVAGATIGTAGFDWPGSHSTILPGAIVEHLTSFGGMLNKGADQTPCTEFLKNGAAGSSGTVTEPYALQEKFPTPFIHVQYAKGFTLAESFYLSVMGPYQLLVLGDPLCRPWGKLVKVKPGSLPVPTVLTAPFNLKPSVSPAVPVVEYRIYADGKLLKAAKPGVAVTLDGSVLGAGYHHLSVVAACKDVAASQARTSFAITVPSSHKVTAPAQIDMPSDGTANVRLSAPGASKIELLLLGSPVGAVAGDHGEVPVTAATVGQGAAVLQPVATFVVGGKTVRVLGAPIHVSVGG